MNDVDQFLRGPFPGGLDSEVPPQLLGLIAPGFAGSPFVGLRPFDVEDGPFFFGRREQTHELLQRLHRTRFVAVVGSSGCGKSSLVRAGLIPALEAGFLIDDRDVWDVFTMKPGDKPLRNLAAKLLSADEARLDELAGRIRRFRVNAVLERLQPAIEENRNVLLVVDQFEETFRFGLGGDEDNRDEAAIFTSILLALTQKPDLPIYVVLTMRSDFMADCDAFPGFAEAMNRSIYLVPRLTRQQRREAIEGPIRMAGATIAPRLLDRLLNESDMASDQLPVLQHALMRTWEEWRQDEAHLAAEQPSENGRRSPVALEHYEKAGTLSHALDRDAEEALIGLDRSLTRKIFQALTDIDAANRQIRRSAKLSVLEAVTGAPRQAIVEILERFRSDGRSFVVWSGNPEKENCLVDLSHESLIRRWSTLAQWVGEEAESASIYRRLEESTARYPKEEGLWSDPQLQQALDWKEKHGVDETWAAWAARVRPSELFRTTSRERPTFGEVLGFLEKSRAARDQERERREKLNREQHLAATRQRWLSRLIAAMVVALILALVAAVFAVRAFDARSNLQIAMSDLQEVVLSSHLVRQSRELGTTDPQRSLLLAAEAYSLESEEARKAKEAENALRFALASIGGKGLGAHSRDINSLEVSPDGLLVSGSRDGSVQSWVLSSDQPERAPEWIVRGAGEQPLQTRSGEEPLVYVAAARGKIAIGGADGSVRLKGREQSLKIGGPAISAIALSADGRWLVAGDAQGGVWIWNLDEGESRTAALSRKLHGSQIISVKISGRWLVTLDNQGHLALQTLGSDLAPQEAEQVSALDLSGDRLALGGRDGIVRLWHLVPQGHKILWETVPGVPIRAIAVNPDNDDVVTAAEDGTMALWKGKRVDKRFPERDLVTELRISPAGTWIAAAYSDGPVRLWRLGKKGKELQIGDPILLQGHRGPVQKITFSTDSRQLFTGGSDGTVRRWDLKASDPASEMVTRPGALKEQVVDVSPDFRWLVTTSEQEAAQKRQVKPKTKLCDLAPSGRCEDLLWDELPSLKFSRDSRWLITGTGGPPSSRWFALRGLKHGRISGESVRRLDRVSAVDISSGPKEAWLAFGQSDGAIRVEKLGGTNAPGFTLPQSQGDLIDRVAITPDGRLVAAAREKGTFQIWRKESDVWKTVPAKPLKVSNMVFSPDGRWLVVADPVNLAQVWSLSPFHADPREIRIARRITQITFGPSDRVILGSEDGTTSSYAPGETTPERVFVADRASITSLTLSSDGSFLATGGLNSTVRVWNLNDRSVEPAVIPQARGGIVKTIFDEKSGSIRVASSDGTIRRWSLAGDRLLQEVEGTVGRNLSRQEWCRSFSGGSLVPARGYKATFEHLPLLWQKGAKCD